MYIYGVCLRALYLPGDRFCMNINGFLDNYKYVFDPEGLYGGNQNTPKDDSRRFESIVKKTDSRGLVGHDHYLLASLCDSFHHSCFDLLLFLIYPCFLESHSHDS